MGEDYLPFLTVLSVLLALSTSEPKSLSASCPPCTENATCHNSTHCVCQDGFQPSSGMSNFIDPNMTCDDIDECTAGTARCKQIAYCKNKIGTYICSCITSLPLFNFFAAIFDTNNPECYKDDEKTRQSEEKIWEKLSMGTRKDIARSATQLLQQVEQQIWVESSASPIKGEISTFGIVYETKRCKGKTLLEAGNNTLEIDCSHAFNKTEARDERAVGLIAYRSLSKVLNGSFFNSQRGTREVTLNSQVVSGTIRSEAGIQNLSDPVFLTLQHTQPHEERAEYVCVHWEGSEQGGSWSTSSCSYMSSNESHTTCQCGHLSSFAVLMALSPKEDFVLSVITYVGLSLSLLCLFLAGLTFLLCRPIQNTSTTLHLALTTCLFLVHFLFLVGIHRTKPEVVCSIIAATLHYLYLSAFMWMFLEGLHLFLTVRNLKVANYTSTGRFKKRLMYPIGYGTPACIVALSALAGHENYGTHTHCWLSHNQGFIWSFLGPVAVIIMINLTFYFQIIWILRSKLSSLNKEVSTIQDTRVMTFKAIAQLFVLGCSWGIGFFMFDEVEETIQSIIAYVFTITNILQGVLIFVIHCVLNRQVRMEYKKWFRQIQKGAESEDTEMSRSTTHTKMEEAGKSSEFTH